MDNQARGWEAAAHQAETRRDLAIDECDRLRALNAELLKALKDMVHYDDLDEPKKQPAVENARAAIAKAGAK